jgi:hypothetical protein
LHNDKFKDYSYDIVYECGLVHSLVMKNDITEKSTLIVIDTNGFLHGLLHVVEKRERDNGYKMSHEDFINFATANILYVSTGIFFKDVIKTQKFETIWCSDTKPYWREFALKKIGINYKGKRQRRIDKENKLGVLNSLVQNLLGNYHKSALMNLYLSRSSYGQAVGYEADDLAAAISVVAHAENRPVIFFTDDTDWLPLCTSPLNTWVGIHRRYPRIRNSENICSWFKQSFEAQKTIERQGFAMTVNHPQDLWKFKGIFGDTSDGIPGVKKSGHKSYIQYIDLYNPPDNHRAWLEPSFMSSYNICKYKNVLRAKLDYDLFLDEVGNAFLFSTPAKLDEEAPFWKTKVLVE